MKKNFIVTISLLLLTVMSQAQENKTLEYFKGETLNGLISGGNFDVQLSEGASTGVTVTIADDMVDKLVVSKTEEGFIRVSVPDNIAKLFSKNKPLVKVVVSKLNYLSVTGSSLIAKGEFSCDNEFKALLAGGAYVAYIKMNCEKAVVEIKGKAKFEDSKIDAKVSCEIINGDSASSSVSVNTETLTATASSMSFLKISGVASKSLKIESSGTSSVDLLDLQVPNMRASALGMSKIKANITGEADVTVGGTASFRYVGNGKITGSSKGIKPL